MFNENCKYSRVTRGVIVGAVSVILSFVALLFLFSCQETKPPERVSIKSGELWPDTEGVHVNAHGGGIITVNNVYYWFGENRPDRDKKEVYTKGVSCYSSTDLLNWKNEGIVLTVDNDTLSDIGSGAIIERPKVIYNQKSSKFVMWFHLELRGQGYSSARTGVAISDNVTGPYVFLKSENPNANSWPVKYPEERKAIVYPDTFTWWTPQFYDDVTKGLFVKSHFKRGQMSRDMTLFVDDDGKAYHIHSSEENLTIHIARLSDNYQSITDQWIRIFPAGHNEAPAVFKRNGKYYMITSACSGWTPNTARVAVADSMMGEWKYLGDPCVGPDSEKTFFSQSTFVLEIKRDQSYLFMADRWRPGNLIDSRYVWLPITFENEMPQIRWIDEWNLSIFKN